MTARRRSSRRGRSLADALHNIPDRLLQPYAIATEGQMVGLKEYMGELSTYLQREMNGDDVPVVDAMHALGIPPADWYRGLLS